MRKARLALAVGARSTWLRVGGLNPSTGPSFSTPPLRTRKRSADVGLLLCREITAAVCGGLKFAVHGVSTFVAGRAFQKHWVDAQLVNRVHEHAKHWEQKCQVGPTAPFMRSKGSAKFVSIEEVSKHDY
jgi:hypothetical protein